MQPTYPSVPADGTVKLTLPCHFPHLKTGVGQSENSFTDSDGDTFAVTQGGVTGWEMIDLSMTLPGDTEPHTTISFFKSDATKIIALIAEAAAIKPVPQTPEQIAAFARRWDARVEGNLNEPTEDMGK